MCTQASRRTSDHNDTLSRLDSSVPDQGCRAYPSLTELINMSFGGYLPQRKVSRKVDSRYWKGLFDVIVPCVGVHCKYESLNLVLGTFAVCPHNFIETD